MAVPDLQLAAAWIHLEFGRDGSMKSMQGTNWPPPTGLHCTCFLLARQTHLYIYFFKQVGQKSCDYIKKNSDRIIQQSCKQQQLKKQRNLKTTISS
jgi:hypothetical protein